MTNNNEMAVPEIMGIIETILKSYQLVITRREGQLEQSPFTTVGCQAGERYNYKVFDAHSWFSFLLPTGARNPVRAAFNIARKVTSMDRVSRAKFHRVQAGYCDYKSMTKDPEVLEKKLPDRGILTALLHSEFEANRGIGVLKVEVIFRPYK